MTDRKTSRADELRDALDIAHSMLKVIEKGGSFSTGGWAERMQRIEAALLREPVKIIVRYRSCDGARERRTFTSLAGARRFAHKWIGEHPDIGSSYAVSFDGIGTIEVEGARLADLFPPRAEASPPLNPETYGDARADAADFS